MTWGFFFFSSKLAKDFVVGKYISPEGDFTHMHVGDMGGRENTYDERY